MKLPLGNDYATISLKRQTLATLQTEADARGMKLYALVDKMLNQLLQQEGDKLN